MKIVATEVPEIPTDHSILRVEKGREIIAQQHLVRLPVEGGPGEVRVTLLTEQLDDGRF